MAKTNFIQMKKMVNLMIQTGMKTDFVDMSQPFNRLKLLDDIHSNNVQNYVNLTQLENKLEKLVPDYINILSSLNLKKIDSNYNDTIL